MTDAPHGKKVVELQMDGGELIWVSPLSYQLLRTIRQQVTARHPEVDEQAYRVPLEGALVPGEMWMPPDEKAAYEAAQAKREKAIQQAVRMLCFALAVDSPDGREAMIARYQSDVAQARAQLGIEGDDWFIAVNYFIVQTDSDLAQVMPVVNRELPVTEGEVLNGLLVFRPPVRLRPVGQPADEPVGAAGDESAPAAPEAR